MGLSGEQITRMERLLDEALELDESQRRAWLQALAPQHHDLVGALERALAQAADPGFRASQPSPAMLGGGRDDAAAGGTRLRPKDRVGPYELERALGVGGMAEVWLAQRADGAFKRRVALKLPVRLGAQGHLARRFARERDILASLEHPHIARFYDAGVGTNGLPYLAMEYVSGQPITDWCDARTSNVAERLRLFLQVLEAVHYAHLHQVIHRDVKPSNILVTDSGQVRLLDFGVAKLLDPPRAQTQLTQQFGHIVTPEYASPEQLRHGPLDARSDVYSLGVVLYELLTGARPYRISAHGTSRMLEQAIAFAPVSRPSTQVQTQAARAHGTTQERLVRALRGDLDAILLKALAKDAAQRYASASELADDLRRHLSGQPVQCRAGEFSYRIVKWVHRQRTALLIGVALGVLAAVALSIAHGWR